MAKRNRKPTDPALIAKRRADARRIEDAQMRAEGIDPKFARYGDEALDDSRRATFERHGYAVVHQGSMALAEAVRDGRSTIVLDQRGRMLRAKQSDIFDAIDLSAEELAAIRHFQDLLITRAGLGGPGFGGDKTDGGRDSTRERLDFMCDAGREVDDFMARIGPPSAQVLEALLCPNSPHRLVACFDVVFRLTGASTDVSQAIVLRFAARGLVEVRADVERAKLEREKARGAALKANASRRDPQALVMA